MDKGLIEIQKLNKILESLKVKKEKNKEKLLLCNNNANRYLNIPMITADLNVLKSMQPNVKDLLKIKKKSTLKFLITIGLGLCPILCVLTSAISIYSFIALAILVYAIFMPLFTAMGFIGYFKYKKKLNIENIQFEEKIDRKKKELETKKQKKVEIDSKINQLTIVDSELQNQIEEIENKIMLIKQKRSEIIDEFIKNSPELESLLNNSYDYQIKEESKRKQKVKK